MSRPLDPHVVVPPLHGRHPRSIVDFVTGLDRRVARVAAYAFLIRDEYPPFRLDTGERDGESGDRRLGGFGIRRPAT